MVALWNERPIGVGLQRLLLEGRLFEETHAIPLRSFAGVRQKGGALLLKMAEVCFGPPHPQAVFGALGYLDSCEPVLDYGQLQVKVAALLGQRNVPPLQTLLPVLNHPQQVLCLWLRRRTAGRLPFLVVEAVLRAGACLGLGVAPLPSDFLSRVYSERVEACVCVKLPFLSVLKGASLSRKGV